MNRQIEALHRELEAAGYKPGTPKFQREERSRRVQLCKEMKSQPSCWDCQYFDHCELIKAHLRDLHSVEKWGEKREVGR